jgi:hypothetical protein
MSLHRIKIAEHIIGFHTESKMVESYLVTQYGALFVDASEDRSPDLFVMIAGGYGVAFVDYEVEVHSTDGTIVFTRKDYRLEVDAKYHKACIAVHDELALKHAMLNLYSAFITFRGWGLLLHSSCLAEGEHAFLFAGQSGAGKSTVAALSVPRPILSDEATIVKLEEEGAWVFTSPFRSDTMYPDLPDPYQLNGIHLLRQAVYNKRSPLSKSSSIPELMNRVFYWAHDPEETKKVLRLCRKLLEQVPVYELAFQKNDTFWEEIS